MADLTHRLSTLALLVEHLLFATVEAAIIIAFALTTFLKALEAFVTLLGALELRLRVSRIVRTLFTAAIFSILVHATGLASREACRARTFLNLTEPIAAISITLAFLISQRALFADFVVRVARVGTTLPKGAAEIRAGLSSGNASAWPLYIRLRYKWILGGDKGHRSDASNNTFHFEI